MEKQIGKVEESQIERDLKRKREITLANHAVDEVKAFLLTAIQFLGAMYRSSFLDEEDLQIGLKEDLVKLMVNTIINKDLYRTLIFLYRIDNFDFDKDLRVKYAALKGVKTTDFEIDPYLSLAQPFVVIQEASKRFGLDLKTANQLITNPTVQKLECDDFVNIEFKEYFIHNTQIIEELPLQVRTKLIEKARIRPYQKSVLKFREIMLSSVSPLEKLFALQKELRGQIQTDIRDFWGDLITEPTKITLNRDELTSIMLFIIARAEVPDLMSQLRLLTEFTSEEIQDASAGFQVSEAFTLIYSTVSWMSQLDAQKLKEDARAYLLKANVDILHQEELMNRVRYDRIVVGKTDGNDRWYDPFQLNPSRARRGSVCNSYLDNESKL